jgi:hypothetical protein
LSGWIKLHRKIQEHWIWQEKPFDKKSAWIDLILSANHKNNKFLLGNELVEAKRGSFITSEVKLSERWGWSRTKVRSFLKVLEEDKMLIKKTDNKKTTLTIVNYSEYQVSETAEEHQKNNEKTSKKHQKNTNKNDKNDKNDKEDIYILSEEENQFIEILSEIENYPLDRERDLEMYKTLEERYPELDLIEAIESWKLYKLDQPLKKNSNPRSQINTSFKNYVKWNKCLKVNKGGNWSGKNRGQSKQEVDEYAGIGFSYEDLQDL